MIGSCFELEVILLENSETEPAGAGDRADAGLLLSGEHAEQRRLARAVGARPAHSVRRG